MTIYSDGVMRQTTGPRRFGVVLLARLALNMQMRVIYPFLPAISRALGVPLQTTSLLFELPGSGNITVTGAADSVNISLPGSGNIYCDGLKAKSATVTLNGSGNIKVFASQSLDASIRGSGEVRYDGNQAKVNKSVIGSGSIMP